MEPNDGQEPAPPADPTPEAEGTQPIGVGDPESLGQTAATERLERRVVSYWYVTDLVRSLVFAAILVVGADAYSTHGSGPAYVATAAWIAASMVVAAAVLTPPLAYGAWRFSVDDHLLSMRYGILFVEERRVPVPRMQHVDLVRGPIERMFGLATLVVFTAGNEGSAFRVPGLSRSRAEALRDRILRARGRDVV